MKVAALDLGSNTFLCLIAETANGEITGTLYDSVEMVRLGEKVGATGEFQPEALARADLALGKFAAEIAKCRPQKILAAATAAARAVKNPEALEKLCAKHGLPLRIIPGEEEARLTYLGGISSFPAAHGRNILIDIGGGSTELILGEGKNVLRGQSLPIGCVKLAEKWDFSATRAPRPESIAGLEEEIHATLATLDLEAPNGIAVAGTATELARMQMALKTGREAFDPVLVELCVLDGASLDRWVDELRGLPPPEITKKFKVHPKRADVILVGVLLLREALRKFALPHWKVSARGIRYGVAQELGLS